MKKVIVPPAVQDLLSSKAPVAVGVSGGKDSMAVALALAELLQDYEGPKLLLHADLGSVEWEDSWPACQRIAEKTGWELASCSRKAGGMMHRWLARWESSVRRYKAMETVSLVLPWSTPSMRFCTGETKTDPICSFLKKKYGRVPILNVTGVRAQESRARAKQPVTKAMKKLPPGSLAWSAIHDWSVVDVWEAIQESGIVAHEAYSLFGSSRVSCRFCILANEADLRASLEDPKAAAIYVLMCDLELESGFAFQGNRWLTSLAPELVPNGAKRLEAAKELAANRKALEDWIPGHLRYTGGWPLSIPTKSESVNLASMRQDVCDLYGWDSPFLEPIEIRSRYKELLELKQSKDKSK